MASNDIAVRPAKQEIIIAGSDVVAYGPRNTPSNHHAVRCCQLLRAPPTSTTIWPGSFLELDAPSDFPPDAQLAVEPRTDSSSCRSVKSTLTGPQPSILNAVAGKLRLLNSSPEPILVKKNDHICQARLVTEALHPHLLPPPTPKPSKPQSSTYHSEQVSLDPV